MITPEEKYTLAFRIAFVAGVFTVVVSALLLFDYSGRVAEDPLNSPEFLELKTRLTEEPQNEALKQELRQLDLELRKAYFHTREFALWGTWLLLGGAIVCLISAKWAATFQRKLPHPEPRTDAEDADEQVNRISRWSVAAVAFVVVIAAGGLYAGFRSALPSDSEELAALLEAESPDTGGDSGNVGSNTDRDTDRDGGRPDGAGDKPAPSKSQDSDPPTHAKTPEKVPAVAAKAAEDGVTPDWPELPAGFPSNDEIQRNWPRFRGPGGLGISAYTDIPTTWDGDTGEGVLWKTAVPLPGNSSPIVWGNRVFLTGANEERREVCCFDTDSGKLLWQSEVPGTPESTDEPPEVGESTGFASPTPTTDGRRVYAMFANGDIAAVDFDGNVRWSRSLGVPKNIYGHAASLAMYQDLVIVQFDQGERNDELSKLLALAAETGETVWEALREVPNSWSSPIVIEHAGEPQIITGADPWVIANSPTGGKEIWRAECLEADVGPTPVYADGVVFVANEFPGAAAIRADGTGNVTETHVVWQSDIGAPDCCSPLATDKFMFLLASFGTLTCFDVKQGGEPFWEEDFEDANFTSSPSLVGQYVYLFDEDGRASIVEPTQDECKRIADAKLGERCVTSPAFQKGRIYIRGEEHLFCIGTAKAPVEDAGTPAMSTPEADAATEEAPQKRWPEFRGPGGSGISAYTNIPTEWNGKSGEGIRWETPVPLEGNSSPIVWGDRVFLTGASEEQREVYGFDAASGKLLWQTKVPGTPESTAEAPEVGEATGFASPTPVTDGARVYAMCAQGYFAAGAGAGTVIWSRSLGVPKNVYGHAASLAMHKDLVIVQFDQGGRNDELSELLGLAANTGETVWSTPREVPNSWSSPVVVQHAGKAQIIAGADPWVIAYSPTDGKEIWRAECLEADVGPSPVYADGIVFVANEFPGAAAIRVGGTGNVTETHVVWQSDIGAPDCCSPLATDKFLLLLASYGTLTCFDVKQGGEPLWEEDFEDANFTSSPSLVGKYVYLFDEDGRTWIIEPTKDECKRIAEASLGERCVTSPAFQDGRLYIRGEKHLFCIGAK